jgi:hypothetical protein
MSEGQLGWENSIDGKMELESRADGSKMSEERDFDNLPH